MHKKKVLFLIIIMSILFIFNTAFTESSNHQTKPRVVVIAIDGLSWHIINPLIEERKLPFIDNMINYGISAKLNSSGKEGYILGSIPILTSMITGLPREQHGIEEVPLKSFKDVRYPRKTTYFTMYPGLPFGRGIQTKDIKGKKIWEYLNENNVTTSILGPSPIYPAEKIKGIMLTGFFTPTFYLSNDNVDSIYPPRLREELLDKVGDYPFPHFSLDLVKKAVNSTFFNIFTTLIGGERMHPFFYNNLRFNIWRHVLTRTWGGMAYVRHRIKESKLNDEFSKHLKENYIQRAKTVLYLMENHPNDFTFAYFPGAGYLKYLYYPFDKEDSINYDYVTEKYSYLVEEYYIFLDQFLKKIEEMYGNDTIIILVSDHGVGPCDKEWCCNAQDFCRAKTTHTPGGVFIKYPQDNGQKEVGSIYDYDLLPIVLNLYDIKKPKNLPGTII